MTAAVEDRELLELAANSAKIGPLDFDYTQHENPELYVGPRLQMRQGVAVAAIHTHWNPQYRDGDKLRSAVNLLAACNGECRLVLPWIHKRLGRAHKCVMFRGEVGYDQSQSVHRIAIARPQTIDLLVIGVGCCLPLFVTLTKNCNFAFSLHLMSFAIISLAGRRRTDTLLRQFPPGEGAVLFDHTPPVGIADAAAEPTLRHWPYRQQMEMAKCSTILRVDALACLTHLHLRKKVDHQANGFRRRQTEATLRSLQNSRFIWFGKRQFLHTMDSVTPRQVGERFTYQSIALDAPGYFAGEIGQAVALGWHIKQIDCQDRIHNLWCYGPTMTNIYHDATNLSCCGFPIVNHDACSSEAVTQQVARSFRWRDYRGAKKLTVSTVFSDGRIRVPHFFGRRTQRDLDRVTAIFFGFLHSWPRCIFTKRITGRNRNCTIPDALASLVMKHDCNVVIEGLK